MFKKKSRPFRKLDRDNVLSCRSYLVHKKYVIPAPFLWFLYPYCITVWRIKKKPFFGFFSGCLSP